MIPRGNYIVHNIAKHKRVPIGKAFVHSLIIISCSLTAYYTYLYCKLDK